jgi:LacI family transcriptional regulator
MAVTLKDIAQLADVSVSTVSRVLNNKATEYRISPDTEQSILEAARKLKYRPNQIARGLRLKKTNTLGVIAPDVSNPFFAYIIKRVQNIAHNLGYSIVVCNTDENLDQEIEHVNVLYRNRVDGLIAMPVGQDYRHFQEWVDKGRPVVLLDRCFDGIDTNKVLVDNYSGAHDAVEHLISFGHRRIAFIQGLPGTYTNTERLRGYRSALQNHNIPVDEELIVGGDFREENGYLETKLLLMMADAPTAVFATSDLITLGALKAIYEEGLSIPEDISMVMFDDFDFAPYLKCPVTAVRQPKELMGEMAVKLLVDELRGESKGGRRVVLKTKLIVRDSVAKPRAPVEEIRVS